MWLNLLVIISSLVTSYNITKLRKKKKKKTKKVGQATLKEDEGPIVGADASSKPT